MITILSVDIALLIIGSLLLFVSIKLPKNRSFAKLFWNKKAKK